MSENRNIHQADRELPFAKENYIYLIAGVALVFIGFLLMMGGKSSSPDVFNPEVFSPMRITVAPLVVLGGFGVVLVGIMKKPKQEA